MNNKFKIWDFRSWRSALTHAVSRPEANSLNPLIACLCISLALSTSLGFALGKASFFRGENQISDVSVASVDRAVLENSQLSTNEGSDLPSDLSPSQSPQSAENIAHANVEAKIKFLTDEYLRLKRYEDQLKKHVRSLDAVLGDAEKLEMDTSPAPEDTSSPTPKKYRTKINTSRLGIGGTEKSFSPIIRMRGNNRAEQKRQPTETAWAKRVKGEDVSLPRSEKQDSAERLDSAKSNKVSLLISDLDTRLQYVSSYPIGTPVQGALSSGFGWRTSPFSGNSHLHSGLDISVDKLSPVVATADGTVIHAGYHGDYGLCVIIQHRSGFETLYGHLEKISVKAGERVCRGEQIGNVGTTGRSTGPHLHYEVRVNGSPRDPKPFVELATFMKLLRSRDEA